MVLGLRVIHSKGIATVLARLRGKKSTGEEIEPKHKALSLESGSAEVRDDLVGLSETDRDLLNARRVLRQAGWGERRPLLFLTPSTS